MRLVPLLMCVVVMTGCISARPPAAEVVGATVTESSDQGARLEVLLEVRQSNSDALPVPRVNYTLTVEGVGRYDFSEKPVRVLPPGGRQVFTLPAALAYPPSRLSDRESWASARTLAGRPWRISGTLVYEADNDLRSFLTESGVPLPVVLFSGRGVLAAP